MTQLWKKNVGDSGSKDLPITQYGGRMGKDEEGDIDDNFVSAKGLRPKITC